METKRLSALVCTALILASQVFAQNTEPTDLGYEFYKNLGMLEVKKSSAPFFPFEDRRLLFTWQPSTTSYNATFSTRGNQAKLVRIAFAHENWRVLHPLSRNEHGVFLFLWDLPRDLQLSWMKDGKDLEYRFIVDGVWLADPKNPARVEKFNGSVISLVRRSTMPEPELLSPDFPDQVSQGGKRTVRLQYKGRPGQEIFVAGTFNAFDPYLHILQESRDVPGLYQIDLKLRKGQYFYYYMVDGIQTLDPLNKAEGHSIERKLYSRIDVPQ